MCGIVGLVSRDPVPAAFPLAAMRDALSHRGPDDAGEWWSDDRHVGLGHRRLSVIDTSPAGRQPMLSASGRTAVIFNGEIYNHQDLRADLELRGVRFRTRTDTEVLLEGFEAWGADLLPRLIGMFACAIADLRARRLLLVRDRAGEKPLFIRRRPGRMLFASELKALLRDPEAPRAMNHEALAFYLAYGYVPGARCLLQGFEKLPPATAMSVAFDGRVERTWKYWELPAPHGDRRPADAAAGGAHAMPALVDRYERLLAAAVERQLVSDVPLGVLLSGGLDSSLVTALAARVSPRKVRTFTVTFPGHPTHDEGPHARLVATHFATDHTELVAGAAAKDVVPALAYQFDEPIADSAIVPFTLLARLIRREATVALGGDGGDELFGGYPHYAWLVRAARAKALTPQLARRLVSRAAVALPAGTKGRHHLVGLKGDIGTSLAHINMYFDDASRRAAVRTTLPDGDLPEQWKAGLAAGVADVRDRAMRADFLSTMVDGYLVKVDRASMASGLEIRAPFLDHTLVEFAFAEVPADVKVSRDGRKLLSRALAARLLPAGFDAARKQGFTIPLSAWFTTGWDAYFAEVLTSDPDLVDPAFVAGLMAGQRAGRFNVERLFALTMLVLWRQAYGVSL